MLVLLIENSFLRKRGHVCGVNQHHKSFYIEPRVN